MGEDGKVRGVRMDDGSEIACDCVISDAGAINTFTRLVPQEASRRHAYDRLLPTVKPSIGHLGVYIGLKGSTAELGLPKTNYWIYQDNDYDAALDRFVADPHGPFPAVYISFPSAKDPDFERRHPGRSTIEIVAPAPYEIFEPWKDTTWGKRGDDYEEATGATLDEVRRTTEAASQRRSQASGYMCWAVASKSGRSAAKPAASSLPSAKAWLACTLRLL